MTLGFTGAEKYISSMEKKRRQLAEKHRAAFCMKPSGKKLLVEAPRKKTKSYSMRKEDTELFHAIRKRLLVKAIRTIDNGADPKAVYHHPAKEMKWSFCPLYEGKDALQIAVLEQSFEPNEEKMGKLQKIIDLLKKK